MLIAMLTMFLMGGGLIGGSMITQNDIDWMNERVELTVKDPDRVVTAKETLAKLEADVERFNQVFIESGDELGELYRDHEASSDEMSRTLERLNAEWYDSQKSNIQLRARLRESITADEWARIFSSE